jgi:hypothetical protein
MELRAPGLSYDLRQGTLRDALAGFFPQLLSARACNSDYLSRCAGCFLKPLCEQCPAKSWMEHGTLDTPVEYWCDVAHQQARRLGLLNRSEKAWNVRDFPNRLVIFRNISGIAPVQKSKAPRSCN